MPAKPSRSTKPAEHSTLSLSHVRGTQHDSTDALGITIAAELSLSSLSSSPLLSPPPLVASLSSALGAATAAVA
jgi:hypothetical protein